MSDATVPLEELLTRLEGEVARIERMARGLEDAIGNAMPDAGAPPGALRTALQDLDLLAQTTGDLRHFVASLANVPLQGDPIPIASALTQTKLARVRAALSGQPTPVSRTDSTTFF